MSTEREQSRGRVYESAGRGGAGNIRVASNSREAPVRGPDDFSPTRGRDVRAPHEGVIFSGRGGAGNVRSVSRGGLSAEDQKAYAEAQAKRATEEVIHSTGRGGAGNIDRSRSRSRDGGKIPTPALHTSGRGGYGNLVPDTDKDQLGKLTEEEERERASYSHSEGLHSHGRGGYANISVDSGNVKPYTADELASVPAHTPGVQYTGRGGAGNIRRKD